MKISSAVMNDWQTLTPRHSWKFPLVFKKKYNDDYFVMILYLLWILSLNQNPIYNTDEIVGE